MNSVFSFINGKSKAISGKFFQIIKQRFKDNMPTTPLNKRIAYPVGTRHMSSERFIFFEGRTAVTESTGYIKIGIMGMNKSYVLNKLCQTKGSSATFGALIWLRHGGQYRRFICLVTVIGRGRSSPSSIFTMYFWRKIRVFFRCFG